MAEQDAEALDDQKLPMMFSEFMTKNDDIDEGMWQRYNALIINIQSKPGQRTKRELAFIADYMSNIVNAKLKISKPKNEPSTSFAQAVMTPQAPPMVIKLNELVTKPNEFDGKSSSARRWIDEYERAAIANGWNEIIMIKYFPTFLGPAYGWFVTLGQKQMGTKPSWLTVRNVFIRHYLGESDAVMLKRQVEQTYQGHNEPITTFMPRLLRIALLAKPNMPEDEQIDLVREKLRSKYIEKLGVHKPKSLQELNDMCLAAEIIFASQQRAEKREANEREKNKHSKKNKGKNESKSENQEDGWTPSRGKRRNRSKKNKDGSSCAKCDRTNHPTEKCFAKTKADGSSLNDPKTKKSTNNAIVENKNEPTTTSIEPKLPPKVTSIHRVMSTVVPVVLNVSELHGMLLLKSSATTLH